MTRAPAALEQTRFDLLVIGGGIHGLFAAYDAAARGLRVALVERGDFGAGLSFNHQRTIHGGLRALESGRLSKTLEQIRERRIWARIAPHYLRPLPFLVSTRATLRRSRWALGLGLAAYDVLAWRRNDDVPETLRLPRGRVLSRAEARAQVPGFGDDGATGAAMWHDYQIRHPDRVNWLVASAARAAGAHLLNYAEAIAPARSGARVSGARVRLWPTGDILDVQATATLLCAGSGLAALHEAFGLAGAPPVLRAMNLLLDRQAPATALAAPGRSGRMLTCVPWAGFALVGTFQSATVVPSSETSPPAGLVDEMLDDVRTAFPFLDVTRAAVRLVHHGLTPAAAKHGRADLLADPVVIRHAQAGVPGVDSLIGVKYTTARLAAARAVDQIAADAGRHSPSHSNMAALPWADATAGTRGEDPLSDWYGGEAEAVRAYCRGAGLETPLADGCDVLSGEIARAAEQADTVRLADAVLRRTRLGAVGHPGEAALAAAADVMAARRGWTAEQRRAEIAEVEARFAIP